MAGSPRGQGLPSRGSQDFTPLRVGNLGLCVMQEGECLVSPLSSSLCAVLS